MKPDKSSRAPGPARIDPAQRLLNEGRALQGQGRIQEAFSRYQSAVAAAPEHPEALHLLGVAYVALGHAPVGIAFMRRAIDRSPDTAEFRARLATAEAQQGRLDEALAQMNQACALQPGDAALQAGLAALLLERGDNAEAERSYQAAIELAAAQETPPAKLALAQWHEALARLRYQRWAMPEALVNAGQARALSPVVAQGINFGAVWPTTPSGAQDASAVAAKVRPLAPMTPEELARACAERDFLVIDDFLADPMPLREQALRMCSSMAAATGAARPGNFPGVQTPAQPCEPTMQRIAEALGRALKWDSLDNGALRVSVASDDARADVHVDNPTLKEIFGGVLCLSLPEDCQGGTRFYRHRGTGWARRPEAEALKERGFASFLDFQKRSLPPNRRLSFDEWLTRRDAIWEPMLELPMRFNRLIIFRSDFFHGITELFGDKPENGRLVQLFHFEAQPA